MTELVDKGNRTLLNLFKSIKIGTLRKVVQAGFTFFCLFAGYRFYLFFLWASGHSENYVPRPPSVEGFLPISGLVGLKRLFLTGDYDMIHPAGLTLFIAALLLSILFRKGFCGWICPVGFISHLAERVGRLLSISCRTPVFLDYPMFAGKYLLLTFFLYAVLWGMDIPAIEAFQNSHYNKVVDAKMLLFFLAPSRLAAGIIGLLILVSFFVRNFWCRYLCPYGALLGLFALASPFAVRREQAQCIDCKRCERICPGSIRITRKETVRSPECIGCLECVAVCPQKDCLTLAGPNGKKTTLFILPAALLALFFFFWFFANINGYWHTTISHIEMRELYPQILKFTHPGT